MPVVLVHGVPETPEVWNLVREHLHRTDVFAPPLPGFGCPRPHGFGATKDEYVAWLIDELEEAAAQGPVDLVGHDWGGGFVVRVVSTRPELVRSWITDAAGLGDTNFEWHEFAKIWQTSGAGEEFFDQQLAVDADERGAVFEMFGVPSDQAVRMGRWLDRTMAESILALYRSAVSVAAEWGPDFHDIAAPGCTIISSEDPFLSPEGTRNAARRAGAKITELNGIGHWWMLQDPARGAQALEAFWQSID
jgi:pimeloyl-ACP methyl ester carboxylesterase